MILKLFVLAETLRNVDMYRNVTEHWGLTKQKIFSHFIFNRRNWKLISGFGKCNINGGMWNCSCSWFSIWLNTKVRLQCCGMWDKISGRDFWDSWTDSNDKEFWRNRIIWKWIENKMEHHIDLYEILFVTILRKQI